MCFHFARVEPSEMEQNCFNLKFTRLSELRKFLFEAIILWAIVLHLSFVGDRFITTGEIEIQWRNSGTFGDDTVPAIYNNITIRTAN